MIGEHDPRPRERRRDSQGNERQVLDVKLDGTFLLVRWWPDGSPGYDRFFRGTCTGCTSYRATLT